MHWLDVVIAIAAVCVATTMLVGAITAARTKKRSIVAVLPDIVLFPAVGLFLLFSLQTHSNVTYDIALLSGVLAFVSTLATARILTKGGR